MNLAKLTCNKSIQLYDAFIGVARQRHDLIGCSETRTVGAQSVLSMCILILPFARALEAY